MYYKKIKISSKLTSQQPNMSDLPSELNLPYSFGEQRQLGPTQ